MRVDRTEIYLIRHGETTGDSEDRYGGDYDDDLSSKGVEESRELANELKGKRIQALYVSPRLRAVHTAQMVAEALNLEPQIVEDLKERNNYGILTGMIKSDAKTKYPNEVKELEKGYNHNVRGSEGYVHFKTRVVNAFNRITANSSYSVIAILTHGGPIKCIMREVIKAGELSELGDCAIITINKEQGSLSIERLERAALAK